MRFYRRAKGQPRNLGILPGTFHPPTRAHLALAQVALGFVDEVLFVLPAVLPHKSYDKVSLDDRVRMLEAAIRDERRFSIASTEGGLLIEIARECRTEYGAGVSLKFLCGRDAAERFVNWDYGRPGAFLEQLREFELLVAPRGGAFEPPAEMRDRIRVLPEFSGHGGVSGTKVRRRIKHGLAWEHLVPAPIVGMVRELYGS